MLAKTCVPSRSSYFFECVVASILDSYFCNVELRFRSNFTFAVLRWLSPPRGLWFHRRSFVC